ncbi:MAG: hypothetical protein A2126_01590 [Candidatus Woykebacteria bacterium GWB1_45_5]|uniref:Type II secretion system protein GspF domain-containing protein n=2 Tax=Candidatus Woykeibacteriota TaxID=1817899 RepID=A0A1G1W4Q2_9BACT|nr:MAG: hypothetical protein A2113_02105 [Candidatus Woykebacteria bacterium GWA1_44_8]OGY23099.1 MAG: hypothetical protein A2126_01590 [Candidatus Woykebacteria bacterium GWB1_45_5]
MKLFKFTETQKLNDNEKLAIIESLSIMLTAGIPILEALDSITEDAPNKKTKAVVAGISQGINSGKTLSESLSTYPESFDLVLINIIKSGEVGGKLDEVLSQVAANLKENIETANNIKSALFYPILVIVVLIGVGFYAFAFALPKVAEIFLDLNIDLPIYSLFILKFSLFFAKYRYFFIAGFIVLLLLLARAFKVPRLRKIFFTALTKIPAVSNLVRYMDLAHFTNTVSLLLTSGVPIIEVLEISQNVVTSPKLRLDINFVKDELAKGSTLAEGMKKKGESFPSLLRRVAAVGENTGNLDQTLANISRYYEKKFTDIIKNISVLLEPILIVLVAILVGAILLSIIVPIYQGIGQLTPHQGL